MRDWRATAAVFAPGNDTAHREHELKCLPGLGVGSGLLVEACSYVQLCQVERKARKGYHACPRETFSIVWVSQNQTRLHRASVSPVS
jgi:hypothetical protein